MAAQIPSIRTARAILLVVTVLVVAAGSLASIGAPNQKAALARGANSTHVAMGFMGGVGARPTAAAVLGGPVMDTTTTGMQGLRYIVTVPQTGAMSANQLRRLAIRVVEEEDRGQVVYVYTRALRGFAAILTPEAAEELRESKGFSVVPDQWMRATSHVQPNPPSWGLDRLDGTLNSSYVYEDDGTGVHIYVMDTGIRMSHGDLAGRADKFMDLIGADGSDPQGHGSHVAGTAAGTAFGLGKQARVHSVRVLNEYGFGNWSDAIEAIDSLITRGQRPAVLNMSLAGPAYALADSAVQRAVRAGITVVVAAGNEAADACEWSPAREPVAITVGATTKSDEFAAFSNWGPCVDILAPGEGIASLGNTSDDEVGVMMDGTSMASPHVAGAAALYLQRSPNAAPGEVAAWLTSIAGSDEIKNVPQGTSNRLVRTQRQ